MESSTGNAKTERIRGRAQRARGSVGLKRVGQIDRSRFVERFVAERKSFVLNSLRNREPVEGFEQRSDVV